MTSFTLQANNELRFESEGKCSIKLISGTAEYRGMELVQDKEYDFTGIKGAIFTFHGGVIETEGCDLEFVTEETNVPQIYGLLNFTGMYGIVGKGRSTLMITLSNFIVRMHRKVIFTELDPETGNLIFPGCVGTICNAHLIGPTSKNEIIGLNLKDPFIWYYGNTQIKNKEQFIKLAKIILEKGEILAKENDCQHLVLLPNDSEIINSLGIDKCIIISDERLNYTLKCSEKEKISKTGYIESRRDTDRRIHNYFYGIYTPYTVNLTGMTIVAIDEYLPPTSALPLGAERRVVSQEVRDVDPIVGAVLGISQSQVREDIPTSPVMGFLVISSIGNVKVLCPQPKLPNAKFLIQGNIRYSEYL